MSKIEGFREKVVRLIVSTFLIFMFADQLLLVAICVFLYLTHVKRLPL